MIPYWYNSHSDIWKAFKREGFNILQNLDELKEDVIYYIHSMHLPIALSMQYKDLWNGPYLHASPEYIKKWEHLRKQKLNIAIRWEGNPEYEQDLHRSVPLSELYSSISNIDANFISIQRDTGLEQLKEYTSILDLSKEMNSWEDTLGIIHNMDLIITSCTSIAHASAAMGKNTIILIPISCYYVWCHSSSKSPWYGDNVTLLRQVKPRSWKEPLENLRKIFI
jgi:hypothetical protein